MSLQTEMNLKIQNELQWLFIITNSYALFSKKALKPTNGYNDLLKVFPLKLLLRIEEGANDAAEAVSEFNNEWDESLTNFTDDASDTVDPFGIDGASDTLNNALEDAAGVADEAGKCCNIDRGSVRVP